MKAVGDRKLLREKDDKPPRRQENERMKPQMAQKEPRMDTDE